MIYIGDLSKNDARVLARYAENSLSVLEFGVGASTQILAQCCPPEASILSVDTELKWIERTKQNCLDLGLRQVEYALYEEWLPPVFQDGRMLDLIFDDGLIALRADFAMATWPSLKDGGVLLLHDTRCDVSAIMALASTYFQTIRSIRFNLEDSNITEVVKCERMKYQNWNVAEGRAEWEYAWDARPENWREVLESKMPNPRLKRIGAKVDRALSKTARLAAGGKDEWRGIFSDIPDKLDKAVGVKPGKPKPTAKTKK